MEINEAFQAVLIWCDNWSQDTLLPNAQWFQPPFNHPQRMIVCMEYQNSVIHPRVTVTREVDLLQLARSQHPEAELELLLGGAARLLDENAAPQQHAA